MKEYLTLIDKHEYVSFDIFDTLITRKTPFPRDIFNKTENLFNRKYPNSITNFRRWRILAEQQAVEISKNKKKREECTLDDIYVYLKKLLNLTSEQINYLKKCELKTEINNTKARLIGIQLLHYALSKEKKVLFVSDMYLSKSQISKLLEKNNIPVTQDDMFFVSSEIGLKKESGNLFRHILNLLNIKPKEMLHIGDNIKGDYQQAKKCGIEAIHLSKSIDNMAASNSFLNNIFLYYKNNRSFLSDGYLTIVSNRFYDNPNIKGNSVFDKDPYKLGYMGLSILIISYCFWIKEQAEKLGLNNLYFLSRDMKVVFDAYNILFPEENTNYILSSRRSIRIPLIKSRADILDPIYQPIYSNKIGYWLNFNYGLTESPRVLNILKKHGINSFNFMIGGKFDKQTLVSIVLDLEDDILKAAKTERKNLVEYLQSTGMPFNMEKSAVIDIGYACSMQAGYQKLLDNKKLHGLYLATFNTATNNIDDTLLIQGYVSNLGSPKSTGHGVSTHRHIYESLFCDSTNSFVCFQKTEDGNLKAIYDNPEYDDSIRVSKIGSIHEGVLDFIRDFKDLYSESEYAKKPPLDYISASLVLTHFLKQPNIHDISILEGIRFHDGESPNAVKYILAPEVSDNHKLHSLWVEASSLRQKTHNLNTKKTKSKKNIEKSLLLKEENSSEAKNKKQDGALITAEKSIIKFFTSSTKYNKYLRDRAQFFYDSNYKAVRWYFNKIGSKLEKDFYDY